MTGRTGHRSSSSRNLQVVETKRSSKLLDRFAIGAACLYLRPGATLLNAALGARARVLRRRPGCFGLLGRVGALLRRLGTGFDLAHPVISPSRRGTSSPPAEVGAAERCWQDSIRLPGSAVAFVAAASSPFQAWLAYCLAYLVLLLGVSFWSAPHRILAASTHSMINGAGSLGKPPTGGNLPG